jgi:thymidylate synthase (FAD)
VTDPQDNPAGLAEVRFRSDVTVELVKSSAADADVLFAARVSTAGEKSLAEVGSDAERSAGLINYLMRDRHGSPFEHNSFTFFVSAPIFVFREFMRHRTFSYNEESGRYRRLEPVFYVPGPERKLVQEGKPGRYVFVDGTAEQQKLVDEATRAVCTSAYRAYLEMLEAGIAREVARSAAGVDLFVDVRHLQRQGVDELPVAADQAGGFGLPVLPAAGDRNGGGADGGVFRRGDATDLRRLQPQRPGRAVAAASLRSRRALAVAGTDAAWDSSLLDRILYITPNRMNVPPTPVSRTGPASIVIVDPVASWTPEQAATGSFHCAGPCPGPTNRSGCPQAGGSDLTSLLAAR